MTHKQIDPCYDCGADMGGAIMRMLKPNPWDCLYCGGSGIDILDFENEKVTESRTCINCEGSGISNEVTQS